MNYIMNLLMVKMKLYKFLRLFWVPKCRHKWRLDEQVDLFDKPSDTIRHGRKNVCQCSKCGEWKSFKV